MSNFSVLIRSHDRIILAIREHIGAEEAVGISGGEGVGVDEPAVGKVVVPALEVVETRFAVVIIATVAQRVDVPDEAGLRNLRAFVIVHGIVAPRAVVVGGNERTGGIQKGNDIALRVEDVVVELRCLAVLVDHGERLVSVVIDKLERLAAPSLLHDLAGERGVVVRRAVDRFAGTDAGHVVGVLHGLAIHDGLCKLAALRPREGIVLAVVVIGAVGRDVFDHQVAPRRDDDPRRVLPVREVVVEAHVLLFNRHDLHFTPLAKSAISRHRLESC